MERSDGTERRRCWFRATIGRLESKSAAASGLAPAPFLRQRCQGEPDPRPRSGSGNLAITQSKSGTAFGLFIFRNLQGREFVPHSRAPGIRQGKSRSERVAWVTAELVDPVDPGSAGNSGQDRCTLANASDAENLRVKSAVDRGNHFVPAADLCLASGVHDSEAGSSAGAAWRTVHTAWRHDRGILEDASIAIDFAREHDELDTVEVRRFGVAYGNLLQGGGLDQVADSKGRPGQFPDGMIPASGVIGWMV